MAMPHRRRRCSSWRRMASRPVSGCSMAMASRQPSRRPMPRPPTSTSRTAGTSSTCCSATEIRAERREIDDRAAHHGGCLACSDARSRDPPATIVVCPRYRGSQSRGARPADGSNRDVGLLSSCIVSGFVWRQPGQRSGGLACYTVIAIRRPHHPDEERPHPGVGLRALCLIVVDRLPCAPIRQSSGRSRSLLVSPQQMRIWCVRPGGTKRCWQIRSAPAEPRGNSWCDSGELFRRRFTAVSVVDQLDADNGHHGAEDADADGQDHEGEPLKVGHRRPPSTRCATPCRAAAIRSQNSTPATTARSGTLAAP